MKKGTIILTASVFVFLIFTLMLYGDDLIDKANNSEKQLHNQILSKDAEAENILLSLDTAVRISLKEAAMADDEGKFKEVLKESLRNIDINNIELEYEKFAIELEVDKEDGKIQNMEARGIYKEELVFKGKNFEYRIRPSFIESVSL